MKKITTLIVLVSLTLVSCDPLFHDDFIIVNNCREEMQVSITYHDTKKQNFIVNPLSEFLFHSEEWVGGVSKIESIDYLFTTIIVKKGEAISNKDYVSHTLWTKENVPSSRRNQYYTNVKYYLIINPEDFEN
jgi:hypothetical protein